ncbi:MAG: DNA primase [Candidatus Omnitrophica bacterium]|nr:DNA primase [Candidatus Omnitrophota bacterium]
MRYEPRIIDQVQTANDIVDLISQVVPLKKSGRNFKGRCPFHDEKTPSFMVSAEKQIFHCFGCGAGGNVFGFTMQYENMSFPEAVRRLADRAHITLPEKAEFRKEGQSETEKIYEIYQASLEYYRDVFWHPEQGKAARDYFQKRGFSLELAKEFLVGWAPEAWRGLFEHLSKKRYSEDLLLKARLINLSEKGNVYDVFRGRLMFPIHNLQGKPVAFGGRLIENAEGPKYLNSPENPVFIKRRELFGLHLAKKFLNRDFPRILVSEGYLDLLRLHDKGFRASVATLGTSLTEEHVSVLKRFAEEAVVVYDGDKAGESASLRGLEVFLEGGLNVKLIRLPEGLDPDDFLLKMGAEAFQKLIDASQDFFDYKIDVLLKRYPLSESSGLVKITQESLETLGKVGNPVLVDRYLRKLAGILGVESASLRQELQKLRDRSKKRDVPQISQAETQKMSRPAGDTPSAAANTPRSVQDETLLLALMIDDPKSREGVIAQVAEGDFRQTSAKMLFRQLVELHRSGAAWGWPQVLNYIEDRNLKKSMMDWTTIDWQSEDRQKALRDCLGYVRRKRFQEQLDALRSEIGRAEALGDRDRLTALAADYQKLLQRSKGKDS